MKASLVLIVYFQPWNPIQNYMLVALILSLIGDIALLRKDEISFMVGLVSFLVAHISYIYAFYLGT